MSRILRPTLLEARTAVDGFTKPISRSWAQAHCKSAAPLIIADRSDGDVQFNLPREFDNCVPGTRGQGD